MQLSTTWYLHLETGSLNVQCSFLVPVLMVRHRNPLTPLLDSVFEQEIGDVENWARSIEMDMRTIATALEYVHKDQLQSASS